MRQPPPESIDRAVAPAHEAVKECGIAASHARSAASSTVRSESQRIEVHHAIDDDARAFESLVEQLLVQLAAGRVGVCRDFEYVHEGRHSRVDVD
jgi:hypothetical protein